MKHFWRKILAFYSRQVLRWKYKGKWGTFDNYLKFQDTQWYCKFSWYDEIFSEEFTILLAQDITYREELFKAMRLQVDEFNRVEAIELLDVNTKKSVRQTIKDSILELKNQRNLELPE